MDGSCRLCEAVSRDFSVTQNLRQSYVPNFLTHSDQKDDKYPPKKCKSQCVHFGGGMFHFVNSIFSNIAIPAVCTISTAPLLIDLLLFWPL